VRAEAAFCCTEIGREALVTGPDTDAAVKFESVGLAKDLAARLPVVHRR
jgi:hypothetical protein